MLRKFVATAIFGIAVGCLPWGIEAQTKDVAAEELKISLTSEIFNKIDQEKIKRLAIIPRIISRDANGENPTFISKLGPLADRLATQLRDELRKVNEEGNFKIVIVPDGVVKAALNGIKPLDLYNETAQGKLRQQADAIILMYSNANPNSQESDTFNNLEIKTEMLDIRQANQTNEVVSRPDNLQLTLSDAAYAGKSFVVRIIKDDKIEPVNFRSNSGLPKEAAFGTGEDWERLQYAQLELSDQHPLQDQANPFRFQIVVNGENRDIWFNPSEGNKAYVALNLEEEFTVQLNNHSEKTVLQSLIMDGVNSISQKADVRQEEHHPIKTDFARHWLTKPAESYYAINGFLRQWGGQTGQNKSSSDRFKVVASNVAEAANAGIEDKFGMVTVIIYALHEDGYVEYTKPVPEKILVASKGAETFKLGIGAGTKDQKVIEGKTGKRGVMLTAMTVYYVTPSQLAELQKGSTTDTQNGTTTQTSATEPVAIEPAKTPPKPGQGENQVRQTPPKPIAPPVTPKTIGEEEKF